MKARLFGHVPVPRGVRPSLGFTLVEAVLSMLVVSVMLVAALNMAGSAARSRQVCAEGHARRALARQLLAEVRSAAYEDPAEAVPVFGCEPGEDPGSRAAFDDVDDYDGWSEQPPRHLDGSHVVGAEGSRRQVSVSFADPADPGGPAASGETGLKRITVTVTAPNGKQTTVVALRSQASSLEVAPSQQAEYMTWGAVELQIGAEPAARLSSGTAYSNRAAAPTGP